MDINITSRNYEVDDDLRSFIEAQVNKIIEEFVHPTLNSVKVILSEERNFITANLNVTGKHVNLNAKCRSDNPKAAIANAVDKITTQMRRYLDRIQDAAVKADPKTKEKIWTSVELANKENEFDDVDA